MITFADVQAAAERIAGRGAAHALPAARRRSRAPPARRCTQARQPPGHRRLQGARRGQPPGPADARRSASAGVIAMSAGNHAQAVARHAALLGHRGHHRHAADTRPSTKVTRTAAWGAQRGAARRDAGRSRRRMRTRLAEERRAGLRPPVRRPWRDRRPGHAGAGDAAGRAGPGRLVIPVRRRRPARRLRRGGAAICSPESRCSASRSKPMPPWRSAWPGEPVSVGGADHRRGHRRARHRRAPARHHHGAGRAECWWCPSTRSRRRSACWSRAPRGGGGCRRRRRRRAAELSRALPRQEGRRRRSPAAISTRASWPTCCCATCCATAACCALHAANARPARRAGGHRRQDRRRSAATSSRSRITACSPARRCRPRSWR